MIYDTSGLHLFITSLYIYVEREREREIIYEHISIGLSDVLLYYMFKRHQCLRFKSLGFRVRVTGKR
jgi:hypothetical protein